MDFIIENFWILLLALVVGLFLFRLIKLAIVVLIGGLVLEFLGIIDIGFIDFAQDAIAFIKGFFGTPEPSDDTTAVIQTILSDKKA